MSKFHIKLNKENKLTIPDFFDTVGEAERFIRDWNLDKYDPEIIRISEEQYTKWLAARIDLGAHEAHLEHYETLVDK